MMILQTKIGNYTNDIFSNYLFKIIIRIKRVKIIKIKEIGNA
jgi:hypothetical protein